MATRRKALPAGVVRAVLRSGVCTYCGEDNFPMTVDHVKPLSKGGTDDRGNLVPACRPCNTEKLDFTPEEWQAWRQETGRHWPPESRSAFIGRLYREERAKQALLDN